MKQTVVVDYAWESEEFRIEGNMVSKLKGRGQI